MEEVLVGVDKGAGDHVDDSLLGKVSSSESSSIAADPVVYKLVRVEGDGRLVPATDDEVMEVEDLLEDDKNEPSHVRDLGHIKGCISDDGFSSKKADLEISEGLSKPDNVEADSWNLNARLEYIEEMLQKVKQEEKLRLSCESADHASKYTNRGGESFSQQNQFQSSDEKLPAENSLQETVLSASPRLNDGNAIDLASSATCLKPTDEPINCRPSVSGTGTSSMPDFSTIKGEIICLDNLSIRELHETFRATFGRATSVKDKLWLKRRIAMGLTNSCDITTTSFIIKGKTLVRNKAKEESNCVMDSNICADVSESSHYIFGGTNDADRTPPRSLTTQIDDQQVFMGKRFRELDAESDLKSEDLHVEQSTAKRVRKPTKRYIEELSEVETKESNVRLISSVKNSEHVQSPKSRIRSAHDIGLARTALVARQESLGGTGVLVPYVSRVRRGRPRENFMALMDFHPNDMVAKSVKRALGVCASQRDGDAESGSELREDTNLSQQDSQMAVIEVEGERAMEPTVACAKEHLEGTDLAHLDSSGDNSDENVATVLTSKGGTRRKHHRAWTLSEVMKLVEGVSRYGAGRWSEIKRLAFASYSYRTSVDLKDKWRNLLRASLSQSYAARGVGNSRKHPSIPIPTPILIRVRELAEMHSKVASEQSLNKLAGRTVHETRSGYL